MFAKADASGDGSVDRKEFIKLIMSEAGPQRSENPIKSSPSDDANGSRPKRQTSEMDRNPERRPQGPGGDRPGPRGGFGAGGPGGAFGRGQGGFGGGGFGPFGPGRPGAGPRGFGPDFIPPVGAIFDRFDKDHKGSLKKEDLPEPVWDRISKADSNGDGLVSKDELEAYRKKQQESRPGNKADDQQPSDKPADEKPKDEDKPKDQVPVTSNGEDPVPADSPTDLTQDT